MTALRPRWGHGLVIVAALIAVGSSGVARADLQITVNSPSDVVDANPGDGICETAPGNGVCTVRAAIMESNHTLSGTVSIQVPASPAEYALTIAASGPDNETTGDLNITRAVSIIGEGADNTVINGNGTIINDRAMSISAGISVVLVGITVRNGRTDQVLGGGSSSVGGGIYSVGTLTVTNSTISGNHAGGSGGAIANYGGTLTVTNSTISGNTARGYGGGIHSSGGTLTATNSTISGNTADADGGGINSGVNNGGGTLTVTNSTVSGNTSAGGNGGGIANSGGTLTVTNSTISGNTAASLNAGGIYSDGTVTVTNSTISGNNAAMSGGGIYSGGSFASTVVFNATIANNQADAHFHGSGQGGGVFNDRGTITFQNSLIAGNAETIPCGGIACLPGTYVAVTGECAGTLTSNGNNMLLNYDTSHCTINGAITLNNPQLGPLADNGGPTQTHALLSGSPAIDAGSAGGCRDGVGALLTTDQRGFARTVDGNSDGTAICDIGAYEFGAPAPATPTPTAAATGTPTGTSPPTITATARPTTIPTPTFAAPPPTDTPTLTSTNTPTVTQRPCVGDCGGTDMVGINDLVLGVNIVLGDQPPTACPAFEDAEGKVDIAQLIKGVRNALNGCGNSA